MWKECPHCHCHILPKANNFCPSCNKCILDLSGATPQLTTIVLTEKSGYPDKCLACCRETRRKVRVGQKLDPMAWHPEDIGLWGRGLLGEWNKSVISPSVIVSVPQCRQCGRKGKPEIRHIDFERKEITLIVHKDFKEMVEKAACCLEKG